MKKRTLLNKEIITEDIELHDIDDFSSAIKKAQKKHYRYKIFRTALVLLLVLVVFAAAIPHTTLGNAASVFNSIRGDRFLVLLGNNSELRPTGGFIGSFAIISTKNTIPKVENFETNIYKADNTYTDSNYIEPPQSLKYQLGDTTSWSLHDSNWHDDFSQSAQLAKWFYEEEYNDSVDGVILINATAIRDILALTGPVSVPDSNIQLTYSNFFSVLTNAIENDYWNDPQNEEINEPKSILADALPELEILVHKIPLWTLWEFCQKALERKDIVLYHNDSEIQHALSEYGWDGNLVTHDNNYISISNSTVGTKTSLSMQQKYIYSIDSSTRTARLILNRRHEGIIGQYDGGDNINFSTVHLPTQSVVTNITVNNNNQNEYYKSDNGDYSSVGFWSSVSPGEEQVVSIDIALPGNIDINDLFLQKQIGSANETIEIFVDDELKYSSNIDKDIDISL